MRKHFGHTGFTPPSDRALGRERRTVAFAELVASLGLALCTLTAVFTVTMGIARANVANSVLDNEGGLFAVALVLGLLFIAMGGLTALMPPHKHGPRR